MAAECRKDLTPCNFRGNRWQRYGDLNHGLIVNRVNRSIYVEKGSIGTPGLLKTPAYGFLMRQENGY
ncbi:hypothetical protein ES703_23729 [subsurface metagenome]